MNQTNPLSGYFRQPSIYLTLPSNGRYYPQGSLELSESGDVAVYPMTAKDEMQMNNPDALLNGQAVCDLIKSCVPAIKDPWQMPLMDLDSVLVAIRIASYGKTLKITTIVPKVNKELEYETDLNLLMDMIDKTPWNESIKLQNGLTVKLRPTTYKTLTELQNKTYFERRAVITAQNSELSPEDKNKKFADAFKAIANITVSSMITAIKSIVTAEGEEVVNPEYIKEFVNNLDSVTAKEINDFIDQENAKGRLPDITIQVPEDLVEKGAPPTYQTPISMDQSNFFAVNFYHSRLLK